MGGAGKRAGPFRGLEMTDTPPSRAVPSGRLARLGAFGKIAGGVAGNVLGEGARRLAAGGAAAAA